MQGSLCCSPLHYSFINNATLKYSSGKYGRWLPPSRLGVWLAARSGQTTHTPPWLKPSGDFLHVRKMQFHLTTPLRHHNKIARATTKLGNAWSPMNRTQPGYVPRQNRNFGVFGIINFTNCIHTLPLINNNHDKAKFENRLQGRYRCSHHSARIATRG